MGGGDLTGGGAKKVSRINTTHYLDPTDKLEYTRYTGEILRVQGSRHTIGWNGSILNCKRQKKI